MSSLELYYQKSSRICKESHYFLHWYNMSQKWQKFGRWAKLHGCYWQIVAVVDCQFAVGILLVSCRKDVSH